MPDCRCRPPGGRNRRAVAAEQARTAADDARGAAMDSMRDTADALRATVEQMKVVEGRAYRDATEGKTRDSN